MLTKNLEVVKVPKVDTNKKLEECDERSRIIHETENQVVLDEGNDYKTRATFSKVGGWLIVAVDWEHPNYGYFADAMLWYKSLHMSDWEVIHVANWTNQYDKLSKFIDDYPEFRRLFAYQVTIFTEMTDDAREEAVQMLRKHKLNDVADRLEG